MRLAELPEDVSPEPVFELMRKTEIEVKDVEARLASLGKDLGVRSLPAELSSYQSLLSALSKLNTADSAVREKIIELLVHKVTVTPGGLQIEFYSGETEIERGLAQAGPRASQKNKTTDFLKIDGSKVLTNGGP